MIVTMEDVSACGLCARGCKKYVEDRGVDFKYFLDNGLPIEVLDAWNDGTATLVANYVRGKAENAEPSDSGDTALPAV